MNIIKDLVLNLYIKKCFYNIYIILKPLYKSKKIAKKRIFYIFKKP
jgi:hypothetical protein